MRIYRSNRLDRRRRHWSRPRNISGESSPRFYVEFVYKVVKEAEPGKRGEGQVDAEEWLGAAAFLEY